MDIQAMIDSSTESDAKLALSYFLKQYMTPSFGALPKNEVELVVLNTLEKLNLVDSEPEVYELVTKLRITRSKARGLIYNRELRRSSIEDLNNKIKDILKRPLIQKSGDIFILEVENPLVLDHLRSKVQQLGFVSDGSFSPNIVKLKIDAIVALIQSFLTDEEHDEVRRILIEAGAPDGSFRGVLKATLVKIATKVASDSGEALIEKASGFITPIIEASINNITDYASELFTEESPDED